MFTITKLGIAMLCIGCLLLVQICYFSFVLHTLNIWFAIYWIWWVIDMWNPCGIFRKKY